MIFVLTIINCALGMFLSYVKARKNSPFFVFYLSLVALFVVPSLFDSTGNIVDFHPFAYPVEITFETLAKSQLVIFFTFVFFLTLEATAPKRSCAPDFSQGSVGLFIMFPLLIPLIVLAGYNALGNTFFLSFITARYGELGPYPLMISYCAIFSVPLAALFYARGNLVLTIAALCVVLLPVLLGGARQSLIISVFALIFCFAQKRRFALVYFLVLIVVLVPVGEVGAGFVKHIRNLPDLDARIQFLTNLPQSLDNIKLGGESLLRFAFYHIMSGIEVTNGGEFTYLLRTLLVWLPSIVDVFSLKPDDFEYDMFAAVMMGRHGTMHPTYFGSIYADARGFFPLWILFSFAIMRSVEHVLKSYPDYAAYLYLFCFYVSIMWARGSLYAPTFMLVLAIIGTLLSKYLLNPGRKLSFRFSRR